MPGGVPDWERINRGAAVVFSGAGEAVTLRSYVSASAGTPKFGVGDGSRYQVTTITGLFASDLFGAPRPREIDRAGGQVQDARLMVTTDRPLHARDELLWRGTAYRLAGESVPQVLGGRVLWRSPLQLGNATG